MSRTRVCWSTSESTMVCRKAAQYIIDGIKEQHQVGECLCMAQDIILPKERRRNIIGLKYNSSMDLKAIVNQFVIHHDRHFEKGATKKVIFDNSEYIPVLTKEENTPPIIIHTMLSDNITETLNSVIETPVDIVIKEPEKTYSNYTLRMMAEKQRVESLKKDTIEFQDIVQTQQDVESTVVSKDVNSVIENIIEKYVELKSVEFANKYRELIYEGVKKRMSEKYDNIILTITKDVEKSLEADFQSKLKAATVAKVPSKLIKVMVVGPLGRQANVLVNEFEDMLDLVFIQTSENISRINAVKGGCDYVVAMKKFINHNISDALKNHKGYILVPGGIETTKQTLLELACK